MKTNWKIIIVSLLIGGFFGSAITMGGMCYTRHHGGKPGMFGKDRGAMRHWMYKKLNLTPEQKTQVDAILKTNRDKLDKLFAATRPQVDAVRADTRMQIRQLLTPEQQSTFDKWEAKREARRSERRRDRMND